MKIQNPNVTLADEARWQRQGCNLPPNKNRSCIMRELLSGSRIIIFCKFSIYSFLENKVSKGL